MLAGRYCFTTHDAPTRHIEWLPLYFHSCHYLLSFFFFLFFSSSFPVLCVCQTEKGNKAPAMLRVSRLSLAIGTYSLFMKEQKNNPALKGLPVAKRGQATAKLYRELSVTEREELAKRAKAAPSATRKKSVPKTKGKEKVTGGGGKRKASEYTEFVKSNISKYSNLPQRERMTAVAKLWKQQKQMRK
ncbi:kinetoplast DNA-associated protein, putative [Trypanosoma brucei gambiense DAL972]|uniref:Kinetoplast DNA-associated protein, putative n=1 Tax=Trypanosoma brucei gambiense (strain MHOM/CI/86/DAL972) TaxID=679716 RepID=D0A408_TRYB9|nr:kinetoplast DNA-associated protein, putative [Trypanosoma brucei gambiense DAL972]CBH16002.1 kinetoplast DNA-associated protein, putative [Trypanosoma brucei gambiense DAL972]|eukprot:XP_011778266.1 kinetoplast DNA-associated protein, putative [Trypanosoma brucei gambiense DAL972]